MSSWVRRLRGALGVGLTWFIGWGALMYALATVIGIVDPSQIDQGEEPWRLGLLVGTVGFVSGTVFAAVLASAERRRSVQDLSLGRAALWGTIGGAALPLLTTMNDTVLVNTIPLGVLFSTATVAIARRAALREAREPDSLPAGPAPRLKA
jgi:hypothetical protein